jgi:glycosyltransferase involved in cell wall biosynthesis
MPEPLPELETAPPGSPRRAAGRPARGRLLIVNIRGFRRLDPFYRELAALGWRTTVLDVDEPAPLRWYARARAFRPTPARWRRRLQQVAGRLARTAFAFEYKSRQYGRLLTKSAAEFDLILQGGAMFAPTWPPPTSRYALFCDCTVKLGEGQTQSGVDFASPESARRWYALEAPFYRNASRIFAASDWVRQSLLRDYGVAPERVVTVGEGSSVRAPEGRRRTYDGRTILYVGYEFERKGGEVLLAAFEKVTAEIPGAELLIAGPPRVTRSLPPRAQLLGPVPPAELSRLYSRSSLFVMPSLFEPFGLVFLEAMEHALPCIGSDRGAIPEIIEDGKSGLIAPAGDAAALAERIASLLRRPDTMRSMGECGRQRVRERFTWPRAARRADAELLEVL